MTLMNLKNLTNETLIENTNQLVRTERRIMTDILWHLKEIEARVLYAKLGYSSLFSYCVGELKYSEPAAARRIHAMRLLKQVPEVAEAIESGMLSVTTAAMVAREMKTESADEKREVLNAMIGKSKFECEKI